MLTQIVYAFEQAHQRGESPRIDQYLPADPAERGRVLRELVLIDLDYRRRRGEPIDPTEYLGRYPELRGDRELERTLAGQTLLTPPLASGPLSGPPAVEGYEVLRELGRGGMGVVYLARQEKLNRLVALKMVLAGGHAGSDQRLRFLAEAEVIARLRHPGIVQVYEFGSRGGQPYFSMEHCEGGSLADRLRGGPLPPREAAGVVERVAQAVHAAHAAGVVHRDLKPANVLLAGGEPKVTDFGLAKRVEGGGHTQTGAVLGTPSYMAPEQARGSKDVGPAADIYALGAVLYECLTGRPPFRAATPMDTVLQVLYEAPVAARLLNPQVPRDLETVCHKCLQKDPARRYPTAEALADDLRRFLDGRPITARPVGRAERLLRWCRREPRVAGLLAVVLLVLVGGVVSTSIGLGQARRAAKEARDEADRAEANLRLAKEAIDECFNVCLTDPLFQQPRMETAKRLLLRKTLPFYQRFAQAGAGDAESWKEEALQWSKVASIESALMRVRESLEAYEKAKAACARLVDARPDVPEYQRHLGGMHNDLGILLMGLGRPEEALKELREARRLRTRLAEADPGATGPQGDLAATLHNLGLLLSRLGKADEALAEHGEARRLYARLAAAQPGRADYRQNLAATHNCLGNLLAERGKPDEAVREYGEARRLQTELVKSHPRVPGYQQDLAGTQDNLAVVLRDQGKTSEALEECREAHRVRAGLAEANPDMPSYRADLARSHTSLGNLLQRQGKDAEAAKEYEVTIRLMSDLTRAFPEVPAYRKDLGTARNNLGVMLARLAKPEEALREYQESLRLRAKQADANPESPDHLQDLAQTHRNLGDLFEGQGKAAEALREFGEAGRIFSRLVEAHPDVPGYKNELARALIRQGKLHRLGRKFEEALRPLGRAIALYQDLSRRGPGGASYRLTLRNAHAVRANTLSQLKRHGEAVADWNEVYRLNENPDHAAQIRKDRADALAWAGDHRRAAAEAGELARDGTLPGATLYGLACVHALCAAAAAAEVTQPLPLREALAERYGQQAVALLRRAAAAGHFRAAANAAQLSADDDLASLRGRDDFRAFAVALPAAGGKP